MRFANIRNAFKDAHNSHLDTSSDWWLEPIQPNARVVRPAIAFCNVSLERHSLTQTLRYPYMDVPQVPLALGSSRQSRTRWTRVGPEAPDPNGTVAVCVTSFAAVAR